MQQTSAAGTVKNISSMLYKTGYGTAWDFNSVWTIQEGQTIAYLKNVQQTDKVNKININYEDFQIEGDGTENNPYIIRNVTQLRKINENLTASFKLANDIDLTGVNWTPIGNSNNKFTGIFDGNGYKITNLSINSSNGYQGLFGYNTGIIKNLSMQNNAVTGASYSSILVGYNTGTITNCDISNSALTGTTYTGEIAGYNSGTITSITITNSNITGTSYVGGLVRI